MMYEDNYSKYSSEFECTPSQYHANIDKLWKALGVSGVQSDDVFTMAAKEIAKLRHRVDQLEKHLATSIEMKTR